MLAGSKWVRALSVLCAVALVGGAGADDAWARKKKKKPVAEAPPPPPVVIPQRPYPPDGASVTYVLPHLLPDGLYHTPNRNITRAQALWNLRSAYNVAALNCPEPQRTEITAGYRAFLRSHARALTAANRQVDAEFRQQYGARFVAPRERYMTHVYNHFAFPPTLPAFCNAVQAMGNEVKPVKSAHLENFAQTHLPAIEIVFDDFRRRYASYQADLAEWDRKYLALYIERWGPPPGMVLTQTAAQASTLVPAP